jgi:hypothetical protein
VINDDVLGLDVSIDDLFVVEIPETDQDLYKAVSCFFLSHPLDLAEVIEQLSTWTI